MLVQAFISCCLEWTTATHYSTAYLMDWWPGCSLSRMLLHVSCRALDGLTTSWLPVKGWTSRSATWVYCSLFSMAPAYLAADCVGCRPKKVVVSCVLPTRGLLSSGGPTATLGTDVWRLPAQGCGTVCLPACLTQTDICYEQFKWLLKTYLFEWWDCSALWLFV